MAGEPTHQVTGLLKAWRGGGQAALDQLVPVIYAELRRLAHNCMRRERPDHTLQKSALVLEMGLLLQEHRRPRSNDMEGRGWRRGRE